MARSYKPNEINKLMNDIKKQAERALSDDIARRVYDIIQKWILEEIYNQYTPSEYERTYNLLRSLTISPVIRTGNVIGIKIYIPNENLGHFTVLGSERLGLKSGDPIPVNYIFNFLEQGDTWSRPASNVEQNVLQELKATKDILRKLQGYLKSKGYKII